LNQAFEPQDQLAHASILPILIVLVSKARNLNCGKVRSCRWR